MTTKERLLEFLAYKKIGQTKFEELCGLSRGLINNMKGGLSTVTVTKIANTCPELNINWLLHEKGNMLNDADKQLPTTSHEPGRSDYMHIVPLLPVSAQGGSFNDFVESIKESDCEKIVSPVKAADFAITVSGDSMMPRFPSGCKILIKKVNEKAFIEWGHVYVLDTCNGVVIKKIEPGTDEHELVCESFNPAYKPFRVNMDDIYGVYKVIMMMTLE